jgi:hypothetical protein
MSTTATKNPDNYFWILAENRFIYVPTRTLVEKAAVAQQLGKEEATVVARDRVCSNLTWVPGEAAFIADKAITDGELEDHPGNNLFNLYKSPRPLPPTADPKKAKFWLDLGFKLFPDDFGHILDCLAFKTQYPARKINHALVLGSFEQGIGKDALLTPVRRAVGFANWRSKGASAVLKNIENNFTPFLRSTILQISEVHEMGDKRFPFYDSIKDWCAAPPDMLTIADKNVKEYPILNAVLPVFTSNHLTDGLAIPPEDRRIFLAWSPCRQGDFTKEFWADYWNRIENLGEADHVAAYLRVHDVSKFKPGDPPIKTAAWQEAVNANRDPGDADLNDVLDAMACDWEFETGELGTRRAAALTLDQLRRHPRLRSVTRLHELFTEKGKARTANHKLSASGYASFANPDRKDGFWKINGASQVIYVWRELTATQRMSAVLDLIRIEELPNGAAPVNVELAEDFA